MSEEASEKSRFNIISNNILVNFVTIGATMALGLAGVAGLLVLSSNPVLAIIVFLLIVGVEYAVFRSNVARVINKLWKDEWWKKWSNLLIAALSALVGLGIFIANLGFFPAFLSSVFALLALTPPGWVILGLSILLSLFAAVGCFFLSYNSLYNVKDKILSFIASISNPWFGAFADTNFKLIAWKNLIGLALLVGGTIFAVCAGLGYYANIAVALAGFSAFLAPLAYVLLPVMLIYTLAFFITNLLKVIKSYKKDDFVPKEPVKRVQFALNLGLTLSHCVAMSCIGLAALGLFTGLPASGVLAGAITILALGAVIDFVIDFMYLENHEDEEEAHNHGGTVMLPVAFVICLLAKAAGRAEFNKSCDQIWSELTAHDHAHEQDEDKLLRLCPVHSFSNRIVDLHADALAAVSCGLYNSR